MLENPRSPRVRAVAKLRKKQERTASGLFLLEGPQSVAEALGFRPHLLVEMYATPTALERRLEVGEGSMGGGGVRHRVVGCLCLVGVVCLLPGGESVFFAASPTLIVVLEEVRDPGNAG